MRQFMIEANEVERLVKKSGGTALDLLQSLMKPVKSLARPPISNFPVAALALAADGRIFVGVNLEFPRLPLHHSVHAEQFLITNAFNHGAKEIRYMAVSSVPCGHCRQFLQELRGASEIKILVADETGGSSYISLSDLLPHCFGPRDLAGENASLLLEQCHNGLICVPRNGISGLQEKMRNAAMEAANRSHAPYTGCPSGVALMDTHGRVFTGSYTESAAFNPSLGPLQAAIVSYVCSGGGDYDEIVEVALVEKEGAAASQETTVRLLIQAISPRCNFTVYRALPLSN